MSDTQEPKRWHDSELPFLDVLEQDIRRTAERAAIRHEQRHHLSFVGQRPAASPAPGGQRALARGHLSEQTSAAPAAPPRRGGELPRTSMRIARRSLTLVALLCLIGASAYGASEVFSNGATDPLAATRGAFALVASGHPGSDSWTLRLYMRGGELCRVLSVAETEASQCAGTPAPDSLEATSLQSPSRRYVFGVAGSAVARVHIRVAGRRQTIATSSPSAHQERVADLPTHVRYYLFSLPRASAPTSPAALVEGVGRDGHALGKPVPSCPETGEPGRC